MTVYFIPVVPLSAGESLVVCETCGTNWDPAVLEKEASDSSDPDQFHAEIIRACVLLVVETESISEPEIEELIRIGVEDLELAIDRSILGELCSQAVSAKMTTKDFLVSVSHRWPQAVRRKAIRCMFLVSSAGVGIEEVQLTTLHSACNLFDFTESEFREIIDEAIS